MVPNTASTLVTRLVCDGFLEREADAADRRVCRLRLTDAAQHAMDAAAAARRAALSDVLSELDDEQVGVLRQGLEVLHEMTRKLRERST